MEQPLFVVTQAQLVRAYDARRERLAWEAEAKLLERQEKAELGSILAAVDAGAPVEPGPAVIVARSLGARVDWRSAFVNLFGEAEALRIESNASKKSYRIVEMSTVPVSILAISERR